MLASDPAFEDIDWLNWLRVWLLNPALSGMAVDLGEAERAAILADLDRDLLLLLND